MLYKSVLFELDDYQIKAGQCVGRLVDIMVASSSNKTDGSPENVICHWNINRLPRCSSRQLILVWPVMKFLLLSSSVIYFIIFIQFPNNFYRQTNLHGTLTMTVDRATCCRSLNQPEDICGRRNCTLPCPDPEPSILELDSDPANFSSRVRDRAFFIETSGSGGLSVRQACAVESLALHNPNLTVYVLFVNVKINASLDTLQVLEKKYNNVHLISIDLDDYVAATALEHWYHCSDWRSGFYVNNLSNGLRLLTLSKYGGYYFDLDIISVRPVTYYRNFIAAQDRDEINNDAIHADFKHPLIQLAIKDFIANFKPDVWGHNGPAMVSRVLKKWCNVGNLTSMDYVTCRGFNVLPTSSFHPVHYSKMTELFVRRMANETDALLSDWLTEKVVGVHIWNKLSKDQPIDKNSTQDYTRLARHHCPANFAIAPLTF